MNMKRITVFTIIVAIGLASFFVMANRGPVEEDFKSDVEAIALDDVRRQLPGIPDAPLPASINLDVPFFPQAPDGNWNLPWKEACEEASIVLAHYFQTGEALDKAKFKEEVLALADWQTERWGHYIDTGIDKTAEMMEGYFGHADFEVINDPTVEQIKEALAQGYPVVAPFAGRELGNPFFSGQGPYYHMLVIKGYDNKGNFITNDVGTRRGENFLYPYETIMSAMTDWGTLDLNRGTKKVLVVK